MLTRRRPSVATLVALLVTLAVGTQTGLAARSSLKDYAPQSVDSIDVVGTDSSSITIGWPPSGARGVVGYGIYVNGTQVGLETPDHVRRWKDKQALQYTIQQLACGKAYTVGVDVVDRWNNRSDVTSTTVSTSACPDSAPPTAPTAMRQVASTETSVMLAWTPSTDNVGVVEYGLYASGVRVSSVSDANATVTSLECGKSYLLAIDAADAAGNRSTQTSSFFRTSSCPSTNKPPTTPTGLKVTGSSTTGVTLTWSPSTDDRAVAGYGLYVSGQRTSTTTSTSTSFTGLQCGTTYTLGVDAFDGPGLRSTVAELSAATSPCTPPPTTGATLTQTIVGGSTLSGTVNWRAVYDKNGDKVQDDPGSMRFLVDGKLVLTEQSIPFGDTSGFWSSSSVGNGKHTFEVRAVDGTGTVVATNSVSASVANGSTPPPSGGDTSAPTVAATAPTNGSKVSGMMTQSVSATDNVGVTRVEFLRDGAAYGQDTTAPYSTSLNTTSVSNGSHTFGARAYDAAGNVGTAPNVSVTVANATADTTAPSTPGNLRVASANGTSVTIAWNAATDNVGVTGYGLYRGSSQTGQTQQTSATYTGLTCGTAYQVGVDAYDAAGNRSSRADLAVTTSACADNQPPTAPTNVTASTRTTTSIALTWAPSSDNVGVAGYGVYNGADLVNTTSGTTGIVSGLVCGTSYTLAVDAFDATGNSSTKTAVMVSTLACTDTVAPTVTVTAPTNGATVSGTATSTVNATDSVGVTKVEFLRDGVVYGQDTTAPYSASINTTTVSNGSHTLGARAYDAAGNTGTAANVTVTVSNSTTTSGCPVSTQHVVDGPDGSGGCWPGPQTTGVPAGTALTTYTGPCTISTANTVIDSKTVNCALTIKAANVTIKNTKVNGNVWLDQDVPGSSGWSMTITDSEVDGGQQDQATICCGMYTLTRVNAHGGHNGAQCENGNQYCKIVDSYLHDPYQPQNFDSHLGGFLSDGSDNITLTHNTIWCNAPVNNVGGGCTGNINLIPNFAAVNGALIERNLLPANKDSSYCTYGGEKPSSATPNSYNVKYRNNVFQRGSNGKCAAYGPVTGFATGNAGNEWTNNTWDNGVAVSPAN